MRGTTTWRRRKSLLRAHAQVSRRATLRFCNDTIGFAKARRAIATFLTSLQGDCEHTIQQTEAQLMRVVHGLLTHLAPVAHGTESDELLRICFSSMTSCCERLHRAASRAQHYGRPTACGTLPRPHRPMSGDIEVSVHQALKQLHAAQGALQDWIRGNGFGPWLADDWQGASANGSGHPQTNGLTREVMLVVCVRYHSA